MDAWVQKHLLVFLGVPGDGPHCQGKLKTASLVHLSDEIKKEALSRTQKHDGCSRKD